MDPEDVIRFQHQWLCYRESGEVCHMYSVRCCFDLVEWSDQDLRSRGLCLDLGITGTDLVTGADLEVGTDLAAETDLEARTDLVKEAGTNLVTQAGTDLVTLSDRSSAIVRIRSNLSSGTDLIEGVTRLKKYSELSAAEAIQADCDVKATNIILQGLPPEVYALVSTHKVAKELWQRIQMLMQGTSLTKQERECKLYDAFDK
nr:hypothetical protein [Tanacetum cinerariifolium]